MRKPAVPLLFGIYINRKSRTINAVLSCLFLLLDKESDVNLKNISMRVNYIELLSTTTTKIPVEIEKAKSLCYNI